MKMKGYVAICFASGVIGALAVVLASYVLFYPGISARMGVDAPLPLTPPVIYRLLFWGGLWGIPFALFTWKRERYYYLIGFLYFLLPVLAAFLFFFPRAGAGYFGLNKGALFTVYILIVNAPFGIVTAVMARWFSR
jgi:hypothetical protein